METNLGIELEATDDLTISIHEDDREAVLIGSSASLIQHPENQNGAQSSLKSSVKTSVKKAESFACNILKLVKSFLLSIKLAIVVSVYSVFGALMFIELEKQTDLDSKAAARDYHLIARNVFLNSLKLIERDYDDLEVREQHWNQSLEEFESNIGVSLPELETSWTFSMAILYAGTIYTTIGYGNIACVTTSGRIATIIYAMFGIPLMIIVLNTLNKVFLDKIRLLSTVSSDLMLYASVRLGIRRLSQDSPDFQRYQIICRRYSEHRGLASIDIEAADITEDNDDKDKEDDSNVEPPLLSSVVAAIAWIFLSAALFCVWEDWTYFTSIYFFFVSLSTIGFGDITPGHPEYMMATFGVVIIGLALLGVCIDVVREKLEQMYFLLLQKLLQEYMERAATGDQEGATKGMMSGFQDKAKFLMPFMSKERSVKVMDKFKEKAKEQGIELPAVLTDIDPETGAPAFASAKNEEFTEYIEKAKAKEESLPLKTATVQTEKEWDITGTKKLTTISTQFSAPLTTEDLCKVDYALLRAALKIVGPELLNKAAEAANIMLPTETQTEIFADYLEKNSISIQAVPFFRDDVSQTSKTESTDSGIQADVMMQNASTGTTFEQTEQGVQCKESVVECGIQSTSSVVSHGVQPEVSSLFLLDFGDEDDSYSEDGQLLTKTEDEDSSGASKELKTQTPEVLTEALIKANLVQSAASTVSLEQGKVTQKEEQKPMPLVSRSRTEGMSRYLRNRGNQTNIELSAEEIRGEIDRLRRSLSRLIEVDSYTSVDEGVPTINAEIQTYLEADEETQTGISCFSDRLKTDLSIQDEFLKDSSSQVEVQLLSEESQTAGLIEYESIGTDINLSILSTNRLTQTDVSIFDMIFDRPTQTDLSAFDMRFERLTQTDFSLFTSSSESSTQTQIQIPHTVVYADPQAALLSQVINLHKAADNTAKEPPIPSELKSDTQSQLQPKSVETTVDELHAEYHSSVMEPSESTEVKPLEIKTSELSVQESLEAPSHGPEIRELVDKSVGAEAKRSKSHAQTDAPKYAGISTSAVETKEQYSETEESSDDRTEVLGEVRIDDSRIANVVNLEQPSAERSSAIISKKQFTDKSELEDIEGIKDSKSTSDQSGSTKETYQEISSPAVITVGKEESVIVSEEEEPAVGAEKKELVMIAEKEKPVKIEEKESIIVAEEGKPVKSAEREESVIIAKEEELAMIAEKEEPPMVGGKEESAVVVEKAKSAMVGGKEESFMAAEEKKPVKVAEKEESLTVGKEEKPVEMAEESTMVAEKEEPEVINAATSVQELETHDQMSTTDPIITINRGIGTWDNTISKAVQQLEDLYEQFMLTGEPESTTSDKRSSVDIQCQPVISTAATNTDFSYLDLPMKAEIIEAESQTTTLSRMSAFVQVTPTDSVTDNGDIDGSDRSHELKSTEVNNITIAFDEHSSKSNQGEVSVILQIEEEEREEIRIFTSSAAETEILTKKREEHIKKLEYKHYGDRSKDDSSQTVLKNVETCTQTDILPLSRIEAESEKSTTEKSAQATVQEISVSAQTKTIMSHEELTVANISTSSTGIQVMSEDLEEVHLTGVKQSYAEVGIETDQDKSSSMLLKKDIGTETVPFDKTVAVNTNLRFSNAAVETVDLKLPEATTSQPERYKTLEEKDVQTEVNETAWASTETEDIAYMKPIDAEVERVVSAAQTDDSLDVSSSLLQSIGVEAKASAKSEEIQTQHPTASSSIQAALELSDVELQTSIDQKTRKSQTYISSIRYQKPTDETTLKNKETINEAAEISPDALKPKTGLLKKEVSTSAKVNKSFSLKKQHSEASSSVTIKAREAYRSDEESEETPSCSSEGSETETPNVEEISPHVAHVDTTITLDKSRKSSSDQTPSCSAMEAPVFSKIFTMNSKVAKTFETDTSSVSSESVYLNVSFMKAEESEQSNLESDSTDVSNAEYSSDVSSIDEETIFFAWNSAAQTPTSSAKTIGVQFNPDDIDYSHDVECQFGSTTFKETDLEDTTVTVSSYGTQTPSTSFYRRRSVQGDENVKSDQEAKTTEQPEEHAVSGPGDQEESDMEETLIYMEDSSSQTTYPTTHASSQANPESTTAVTNTETMRSSTGVQSEQFSVEEEVDNTPVVKDEAIQPRLSYLFSNTGPRRLQSESAEADSFNFVISQGTDSNDLITKLNIPTQTKISTADAGNQVSVNVHVKQTQYEKQVTSSATQTNELVVITEGIQFDEEEHQMARHLYMRDIGLQTGVLARVEHIMSPLDLGEEFFQERNKPPEPHPFSQHLKTASTSEVLPEHGKRTHSSGEIPRYHLSTSSTQQKRTSSESHEFRRQSHDSLSHSASASDRPPSFLPARKRPQTVADLRHMFDDNDKRGKSSDDRKT